MEESGWVAVAEVAGVAAQRVEEDPIYITISMLARTWCVVVVAVKW